MFCNYIPRLIKQKLAHNLKNAGENRLETLHTANCFRRAILSATDASASQRCILCSRTLYLFSLDLYVCPTHILMVDQNRESLSNSRTEEDSSRQWILYK